MASTSPTSKEQAVVDALLGPPELTAILGVPLSTIYKWNAAGTGPRFFKVGRHVRWRRSDVDAWLERNASQPRPA